MGDRKISERKEKKRTKQGTERRVEKKRREDKIGSTKGNRKEESNRLKGNREKRKLFRKERTER